MIDLVSVTALICLTIIAVVCSFNPEAVKFIYYILALIAGITGVNLPQLPGVIRSIRGKVNK